MGLFNRKKKQATTSLGSPITSQTEAQKIVDSSKGNIQQTVKDMGITKDNARLTSKVTSSGGGSTSTPTQTPTPTPTPTPTTTTPTPPTTTTSTPTTSTPTTSPPIKVLASGGVTSGKVKYIGKAVVPGSGGLTANQIQTNTFIEARKKFGKGTRRGTYNATITPTTTKTTTTQSNLNLPTGTKFVTIEELANVNISNNLAEQLLSRNGINPPTDSPFVSAVKNVPFYNKTLGEAFAKEGFQKPSGLITKSKEGIKDAFQFMASQPSISDLAFSKDNRAIVRETRGAGSRVVTGGILGLVPETAGQLITQSSLGILALTGGSIVRTGISATMAVTGTRGSLNKDLTAEQRVTSGIVGGLGIAGFGVEGVPFFRAGKTLASKNFGIVKTEARGFQFLKVGEQEIGIIQPGSPNTNIVNLPRQSPLARGGFGVKSGEKGLFLGEGQTVATSQIGLVEVGKSILLEREFFVTPQDPFVKIPATRLSRLGLQDLFKTKLNNAEIGFGGTGKPQILILEDINIGRTETGGKFRIGSGSELEGIRSSGTLTGVERLGGTIIKGQGVEVIKVKFSPGELTKGVVNSKDVAVTTEGISKISGESFLSSLTTRTSGTTSLSSPVVNSIITNQKVTTPTTTLTKTKTTFSKTSTGRGSTTSISVPTSVPNSPRITPNISPPRNPKITTTISPPRSPPITTRITPPKSPPLTPRMVPPTTPPRRNIRLFRSTKPVKVKDYLFGVQVRRGKKFRSVGTNLSLEKAQTLGRNLTQRGLGQTYKITGPGIKSLRTPQGYYAKKDKREGLLFIEKSKSKINTGREKSLLQQVRARKKKKRGFFDEY